MANIGFYSDASSDFERTLKSKRITPALATGVYSLFRIPRYALITDIWVDVATAFDGTTPDTVTLGFGGNKETQDDDGFMDAAAVLLSTAGIKRATSDGQPCSEGKYFDAAGGVIVASYTNNDSTVGSAYVFVKYCMIY